MADNLQFNIHGVDALVAKLDAVSYDMRRKGGRAALRRAAELVAAKARAGANRIDDPTTSDDISKNIAIRWNGKLNKSTGDLGFRVGVLGGARQYANTRANRRTGKAGKGYALPGDKTNPGGDTYYWRHLEFGTEKMAARPFMRSALADSIGEATMEFVNAYNKSLDSAIKRAAKAGAS
ncbi:HK97-gp10 family putative phage morphogenesis protein [Pseudomonas typographi]|uniref:HK97-gp10 family putative phage morphogenesis protein n=1 Tax=Pseudomonas typographi TaxID=2715964 RepID=UPI001689C407|nr:HK97-gp10 family putative phage morphogenesis protein [Pseudomonas typographi]MBD1589666.1 hypothetical protein [Pseudomonas typographi]